VVASLIGDAEMKKFFGALGLVISLGLGLVPGIPGWAEPSLKSRIDKVFTNPPNVPRDGETAPPRSFVPELPTDRAFDLIAKDKATKEALLAALRAYYQYNVSGFHHRSQVFEWQLFSSKVVFWVVIILVAAGVYFSGVQFHASLEKGSRKILRKKDKSGQEPPTAPETTEILATLKGIKVTSPVLGVIILMISFLFFYLFLVYVYPIRDIL
jgi:hypothetical protein